MALLPSLRLALSASRATGIGSTSNATDYTNSAMLSLRVPLYQGGAEYAAIQAAKHKANQVSYQQQDIIEEITERVNKYWQDLQTSQQVIVPLQTAVSASVVALQGAQQEYKAGTRTALDVLNAEKEFLSAKQALLRGNKERTLQAYRMLALLGGLHKP
jgi:outer membrane protein